MLASQLAAVLAAAQPGVTETLAVVDGLDDALVHGLSRLGGEQTAALTALASAVAVTPLGDRVGEAIEKIKAGSIGDEHLAALAAARSALLGAVHDELLTGLDTALGRTRAPWQAGATPAQAAGGPRGGARSWLGELAITGWHGVDHELVSGGAQAIDAVLSDPASRRLAVLLDGLAAELRTASPVATMELIPARRWADLWTRAVLLSQSAWTGAATAEAVTGRLMVLGADLHEHATAVQIEVHGILETPDGAVRLVRAAVSAAKVDTIVGPAVWKLFADHPVLTTALAERRSIELTGMPLLDGGDLVWIEEHAAPGEPADPFTTARVRLPAAVAPASQPLDRHPARIAEPVLVEGYTVSAAEDSLTFDLGGGTVAIDLDRLPAAGPITKELLAASTACLGLLRWDAGDWTLQPLALQATVKKKPAEAHTADWAQGPTDPKIVKAAARAGDAVAVLRERAGRLLRK
ncbi:hypothetical protein AB0I28_02530 [Phytomonospora sp. NPDC050363]|uniref:hypothetical protein n=1 Tax=Phytomonospora sp. NPDC050363 TaxID=3155642 RepID=UPI0033E64CC0